MTKFILTLMVMLFSTSALAGVVDKKRNPQQSAPQASKSELGKTKLFNDINALDINLKAIQEAFDTSKNTDNVVYFTYRPDFTAKIRLRVGMRSMIHLDKRETIKSYIVGNPSIFKVQGIITQDNTLGIIPNILTIKSLYPGADTNLTILTESGNIYNFYLRSDPVNSKHMPHFTVYMQLEDKALSLPFQFKEKKGSEKEDVYDFNFVARDIRTSGDYLKTLESGNTANTNYRIYGDAEIAPFAVYDDGTFTYFDYRHVLASDRLPVIYKVVDKYDTIVNFRMEKGFLIAESLSPEGWTLKNGKKNICVKPTKDIGAIHGRPNRPQMKGKQ